MFQHAIKIMVRKQPAFTALNLGGLVIGMTACLLLWKYVRYELAYDRQSPHAAHIWRVFNKTVDGGNQDANTHSAIGPTLKAEVPEVLDYFRLYNGGSNEVVAIAGRQPFELEHFFCTDPGFLRMMPQQGLYGHLPTALDAPYSAVLPERTAKRLFGLSNAVGQTLRIPSGLCAGNYTVTAVVADAPANTHLKFDLLVSYSTRYAKGFQDNFDSYWDYNYFQLAPGADTGGVQRKLAAINEQYLKKEGIQLDIQRFTDIHLKSALTYEIEPNGSVQVVRFLSLIALFVLGIALINYVNLSTAMAGERAKEIAVRKTAGAGRLVLIRQLTLESMVLCFVAFALSAVVYQQVLPAFGDLIGRPLYDAQAATDWAFWGGSMLAAVMTAFLAGIYPAVRISGITALSALKGRYMAGGVSLRKGLVATQFICSIGLTFGLIVVGRQVQFLKQHDLGIQLDQMVCIKAAGGEQDSLRRSHLDLFKVSCAQIPGVSQMAASSMAPGLGINSISGSNRPLRWTAKPDDVRITSYFVETDEHFFQLYGIPVLAGEYRQQADRAARFSTVAINRSMLEALGFPSAEAAIGQSIQYQNSEQNAVIRICAVVEDFHIESLKTTPKPTLYYCFPPEQLNYLSIKITAGQIPAALSRLEQTWQKLYPEHPFRYWFLDDHFAQQYRSEQQFGRVFGLFTGLSMVVSSLGLLGLAAHSSRQRRKEIGVRKVLGASVGAIVAMMARDYLKLLLIALVIAAPLAYYGMRLWLDDFAYRIRIEWWMFALAAGSAIVVAGMSVGFQSVKAALQNPVNSLKES